MDRVEFEAEHPSKVSSSSAISPEAWIDVLECVIGTAHAVLPASSVRSVLELELSAPPPLGRKWLGGLGVHLGHLVVCINLAKTAPAAPRVGKGILCALPASDIGWMIEVSKVMSLLKVRRVARAMTPGTPSWVTAAQTVEGRLVAFVDVERMVRELAASA